MTMSKRNLFVLVISSAIAVSVLWALLTYRLSQLERSSEQFSQILVETFFSSWDADFFRNNASAEFIAALPDDALLLYIENMKAVGMYQETLNISGNIDPLSLLSFNQDISSIIEADVQLENDQVAVFI